MVNRRIGIMGGSFNPPHLGHLRMALVARRVLHLHQVWWLVSPQNPLKTANHMAPLAERLAMCNIMAQNHPWLKVRHDETQLKTRYTYDTLRALRQRHKNATLVWLMGADNLAQAHHWKRWKDLFRENPVAVLARPGVPMQGTTGPAATAFARARQKPFAGLRTPPGWRLVPDLAIDVSATEIRHGLGASTPAVTEHVDMRVLAYAQLKRLYNNTKL